MYEVFGENEFMSPDEDNEISTMELGIEGK